jgi:hypothetical protein
MKKIITPATINEIEMIKAAIPDPLTIAASSVDEYTTVMTGTRKKSAKPTCSAYMISPITKIAKPI